MGQLQPTDCIECQKVLKHWIEFQLVDEQGKPLAGMPYKLVSISNKNDVRTGVTNGEGLLKEESLPPTPVRIWIDAQKLADEMELRPLRTVREPLGSKAMSEARKQGHHYRYVKIGDLCDKAPKIDSWNEEELPKYHFPDNKFLGFKAAFVDKRWVLEVCPFRAWTLLLHHQKEYSLVNAYNQGLMAVLVYANAKDNGNKEYNGSVLHFFKEQLLDLSRLPNQIEQKKFQPIVYDVPFRERYTNIEFISTEENRDTQLFYALNKNQLIISWRGTASGTDFLTDIKFKPTKLPENYLKTGKAHDGFWQAFLAAGTMSTENTKISVFNYIKELARGKKVFICGHSLGGALALLHSVHLKNDNPCLYTYGMPRALTSNAVMEVNDIIHYRHINQSDPIPAVPFEKNMDNFLFQNGWDLMGYIVEGIHTLTPDFPAMPLSTNKYAYESMKSDEIFLHQGNVVHLYLGNVLPPDLYVGVQNIKANLYLVPTLLPKESVSEHFFPKNKQPKATLIPDALGLLKAFDGPQHLSGNYMKFIKKRVIELYVSKQNEIYKKDIQKFKSAVEYRKKSIGFDYSMYQYFLRLDQKLESYSSISKESELTKRALSYFIYSHSK